MARTARNNSRPRASRGGNIKVTIRYSVLLIVLFGFLSALILSSIFRTVLAGLVLSYVFYPIYKRLYARLRMKTVSALIMTVGVMLLLTIPAFLVINKLSTEASVGFVVVKQYLESGGKGIECEGSVLCGLLPHNLKDASPQVKALLTNTLGKGTEFIVTRTTRAILALPGIVLNLFIVFFLMYYLLKDGAVFVDRIKKSLPLRKQRQDALIEQFNQVSSAVIYGTVVIAILQGVLAGIGFYLFGVPSPVIWGVVTLIVSLVPFLGPFIIWLPASLVLIITGYYAGDNFTLLRGVGLFLYGLLLVSGIDNVLKPRIIARKANIHPGLVLIGIIGGINLFGIVGLVVGPVIIAMLKTAFEAYLQEKPAAETV
ncbi:AI-2E family transporter [Candidatus Woesearchaeota archaeon]|nr:AI-2E family transporter [Candidatus Woesearchaeota archaeon]